MSLRTRVATPLTTTVGAQRLHAVLSAGGRSAPSIGGFKRDRGSIVLIPKKHWSIYLTKILLEKLELFETERYDDDESVSDDYVSEQLKEVQFKLEKVEAEWETLGINLDGAVGAKLVESEFGYETYENIYIAFKSEFWGGYAETYDVDEVIGKIVNDLVRVYAFQRLST